MRHIVSLLMENEAGALSRVAGLFSARGYNIESQMCIRDRYKSRATSCCRRNGHLPPH